MLGHQAGDERLQAVADAIRDQASARATSPTASAATSSR